MEELQRAELRVARLRPDADSPRMETREQRLEDPARQEVARTDAIVLRAEAERLAGRLGCWRRRLEEADGPDRR